MTKPTPGIRHAVTPGYSSIAAHPGYPKRESFDTLPPCDWFDIISNVTGPPDHFTWTRENAPCSRCLTIPDWRTVDRISVEL